MNATTETDASVTLSALNRAAQTAILNHLSAPFPPDVIKLKIQATTKDKTSGMVITYIDARDVMDRLDQVVGAFNWSDEYVDFAPAQYADAGSMTNGYKVECRLTVLGVTKADVGNGGSPKDAYSDALKRAAVKFGVGRFLYSGENVWVPLENNGRKIAKHVNQRDVVVRILNNAYAK